MRVAHIGWEHLELVGRIALSCMFPCSRPIFISLRARALEMLEVGLGTGTWEQLDSIGAHPRRCTDDRRK
jgi:hypothetical protein